MTVRRIAHWQISRTLCIFSLCAITLLFVSCQSSSPNVAEGHRAPKLEIHDAKTGGRVALDQYTGRVMFINFWATWCAPCREELPSIEALYREFGSDGRFVMLTVLYKDAPESASQYMGENGYSFPIYTDPDGTSAKEYGVTGVPETYLVDKKGVLRKKIIGSLDWSSKEARSFVNALLLE